MVVEVSRKFADVAELGRQLAALTANVAKQTPAMIDLRSRERWQNLSMASRNGRSGSTPRGPHRTPACAVAIADAKSSNEMY